jgi:dynein heavy chain 2, cytosolic
MRNQYECRTLFEFFVSRIQKNLSIVISMDYSHPKFLHNCSSNPALYTKCTILWTEGWSKESMIHVSKKELQEVLGHMNKGKDEIVQAAINIQLSSQELGASPLKYLNFIQNFRNLYTKISSTSGGQSKHLMAGI